MNDKVIPWGSFIPYFRSPDNDSFSMQIGGTVYEVTTHFDTDGKETVLKQFRDLLLELQTICPAHSTIRVLHGILALPCNARLSERRPKNQ